MKSLVTFFSLNESQDEYFCVCETVKKLYKIQKKILIISDVSFCEKIDNLLWSFEQNSFIPHKIYNYKDNADTPVMIITNFSNNHTNLLKNYSTIINVTNTALINLHENLEIYEFVGNDEARKNICREKYLAYKNNKFELLHKNYQ